MQSSNSDTEGPENNGGTSLPEPDAIPKQLAEHVSKLYAEYIKPELFLQWLVEQELVKRKLDEQQREFEFQYQLSLAHRDLYKYRRDIECELVEQLNGEHVDLRQQHDGGCREDSSSDSASSSASRD